MPSGLKMTFAPKRHSLDANAMFSFYGQNVFDENDKLDRVAKMKMNSSQSKE